MVLGALRGGHAGLRDHGHGLAALEAMLVMGQGAGDDGRDWDDGWAGWDDPVKVTDLLLVVGLNLNAPESPPALSALLDSRLPCACAGTSMAVWTTGTLCSRSSAEAQRGRRLCRCCAQWPRTNLLQPGDLLGVIDNRESPAPLEALLAVGTPPLDRR